MDKFRRTTTSLLFFLLCVIFILQFQLATLDDEGGQNVAQDYPEKPLVSQLLIDTISILRNSHRSSWEKIQTVIHDLQMQFSPPNLDFRGVGEVGKGSLIEAAEKSFDKSKETVEESAESAAKVVEEAFHMKIEEAKERADPKQEDKAEL